MKKLWKALLLALLVAGLLVAPAAAATNASTCGDYYLVQPGDYLSRIAANCGMTMYDILVRNPQIWNPNLIYYGQSLRLTGNPIYSIPGTGGNWYVVQPGDYMQSIALRYGVNVWQLIAWNPQVYNPWLIYPGQQILVPGTGTVPPNPPPVVTPTPVPVTSTPYITLSTNKVAPGGSVTANVTGFPANTNITFQAGKQGDGYVVSVPGKTDGSGNASAVVSLAPTAAVNENWILMISTSGVFPSTMAVSPAITITAGQ